MIDANEEDADWTKSTWDVYGPTGQPARTVEDLHWAMPSMSDADLKALLQAPVARSMPAALRRELAKL